MLEIKRKSSLSVLELSNIIFVITRKTNHYKCENIYWKCNFFVNGLVKMMLISNNWKIKIFILKAWSWKWFRWRNLDNFISNNSQIIKYIWRKWIFEECGCNIWSRIHPKILTMKEPTVEQKIRNTLVEKFLLYEVHFFVTIKQCYINNFDAINWNERSSFFVTIKQYL